MGLFKPDINKMRTKKDTRGLIKALEDKNEDTQKEAAKALGEIGDVTAIGPLTHVLKDAKNKDVRFLAAGALSRIGNVQAVGSLIEALEDKDWGIRSAAAEALGKIKDTRAEEPLCETLRLEETPMVRDSVVWALGEIKDVRAVEGLIWDMWRPGGSYALGNPQKALASIGEPAVDALIESLREHDESFFQSRVIRILVSIGEPAVERLNQALKDENENVQKVAQHALREIKAKST
jgi:HEAT repeat protein